MRLNKKKWYYRRIKKEEKKKKKKKKKKKEWEKEKRMRKKKYGILLEMSAWLNWMVTSLFNIGIHRNSEKSLRKGTFKLKYKSTYKHRSKEEEHRYNFYYS